MNDLRIITSEKLSRFPNVRFAMSTRQGGVSPEPLGMNLSFRVGDNRKNVEENRRRFFAGVKLRLDRVAVPLQCHSDNVLPAVAPGEHESCDGLITILTDLPLVVSVADCVPVALYDPKKSIVGLVHGGWRGTAKRIVAKAVGMMVDEFGASAAEMVAYLGPSASVCCYEVGPEVASLFESNAVERRGTRLFLNLKRVISEQLIGKGLKEENIEVSNLCTICNPLLFHSHRRDGNRSGRMMAVVCLSDHQ